MVRAVGIDDELQAAIDEAMKGAEAASARDGLVQVATGIGQFYKVLRANGISRKGSVQMAQLMFLHTLGQGTSSGS